MCLLKRNAMLINFLLEEFEFPAFLARQPVQVSVVPAFTKRTLRKLFKQNLHLHDNP